MSNQYQEIDSMNNDFKIRRNRYLVVLTGLIALSIISFVAFNYNTNSEESTIAQVSEKEASFKYLTLKLPTPYPTDYPTKSPRLHPTHPPTKAPRFAPTPAPTKTPHAVPSKKPTDWSNTYHPTLNPVFVPTVKPSKSPIFPPTNPPTKPPRLVPTHAPYSTPKPTKCNCVDEFVGQLPIAGARYYIDNPIEENSYTTAHVTTVYGEEYDLPVWCLNYRVDIFIGNTYNASDILTLQQIQQQGSLLNFNSSESLVHLSQVQWIFNNIKVGDLAEGPQDLDGQTFNNPSNITASDYQAAIWWLMDYHNCNFYNHNVNCQLSLYITDHTLTNAAYIINKAFAFVPEGTPVQPQYTCSGDITVPVVFLALEYTAGAQPLVVDAPMNGPWGFDCPCGCVDPTFEPTLAPTKAPHTHYPTKAPAEPAP